MRNEFFEVDFINYYYDNGICIPIKKFKIEKGVNSWGNKKIPVDSFESDAFADCIGIDGDEKILFIGSYSREYFEEKDELEDWLREYFLGDTVSAIFGFIRKRYEAGEL